MDLSTILASLFLGVLLWVFIVVILTGFACKELDEKIRELGELTENANQNIEKQEKTPPI